METGMKSFRADTCRWLLLLCFSPCYSCTDTSGVSMMSANIVLWCACTKQMGLKISWRLKRHGALETIKLVQPCPAGPCKELKKVFIVLCSDFLRTRPPGLNVLWENTSSSLKALRSSRIGYVKLRGSLTPASPPPLTRALWKTGCYSWR